MSSIARGWENKNEEQFAVFETLCMVASLCAHFDETENRTFADQETWEILFYWAGGSSAWDQTGFFDRNWYMRLIWSNGSQE